MLEVDRLDTIARMRRHLLLLSGLAFVAGVDCASMTRPTVRKLFTEHGLDRAVFEMQCPKEKVELVRLNVPLDEPVAGGAQVGVTGCGKQVVYVFSPQAGWIANTASVTGEGTAH